MRRLDLPIVLLTLLWTTGAVAQPSGGSPFAVDYRFDGPVMAFSLAVWMGGRLVSAELPGPSCLRDGCDAAEVNGLDRAVIGNESEAAATLSDVLLISAVTLPFLLDAGDVLVNDPTDGWAGFGYDAVVMSEALLVNSMVTLLVKMTVRRPRPLVYADGGDAHRQEATAAFSFYSGHTSTTFCMGAAYATLFAERHPDSPAVVPVWIVSMLLAGTTGWARVEAGRHFWTDVIVGAVSGTAVALLVSELHMVSGEEGVEVEGAALVPSEAGWFLAPTVLPGGFGMTLTVR